MHFQKAIELLTEIIVGKEESISLLELKRRSVEKRSGEDRRKKKPRKRKMKNVKLRGESNGRIIFRIRYNNGNSLYCME